jgi:hypothetical protein
MMGVRFCAKVLMSVIEVLEDFELEVSGEN